MQPPSAHSQHSKMSGGSPRYIYVISIRRNREHSTSTHSPADVTHPSNLQNLENRKSWKLRAYTPINTFAPQHPAYMNAQIPHPARSFRPLRFLPELTSAPLTYNLVSLFYTRITLLCYYLICCPGNKCLELHEHELLCLF